MRWLISVAILVAYFVAGAFLSEAAHRYLRDPNLPRWDTPLLNPELFAPEGERYRRRAIRYWTWVGVLVALLLLYPPW